MLEPLAILLGIGFIVGGGMKLNNPQAAVETFASWGVREEAVILLAGWVEVILGLALLNPPTRPASAIVLSAWMLFWGAVQVIAGSAAAWASAGVLLVMVGYLMSRPGPLLPRDGLAESPLRDPPRRAGEALHRLFRIVGVAFLIRWAIGGVTYWLAIPLLALADRESGGRRAERALLHLLVLGIGVSGVWGFVGHTFMSETVSESVGWAASPFQRELAFYHLGIGFAGLACWWIRDHFWLAVTAITSIFLLGAGWVHLGSFLQDANTAPTNWGLSVLFGNLILPVGLVALAGLRAGRGTMRGAGRPEPELATSAGIDTE